MALSPKLQCRLQIALQTDQAQPSSSSTAHAMLYHVSATLSEGPPTYSRLWQASESLAQMPGCSEMLSEPARMLRAAIEHVLKDDRVHAQVWYEYERLLAGPLANVQPWASAHATPDLLAVLEGEACPFESGKACPFADYYCVDRFGGPCDHVSCGLKLAGRIWIDVAAAERSLDKRRAEARRRRFAQQHLETWVRSIAEVLAQKARTEFYVALAVVMEALIKSEERRTLVRMKRSRLPARKR